MGEWSKEPPTEPGWYWYRAAHDKPEIWQIFGHEDQLLPHAEWWTTRIREPDGP